MRGDPIRTVEDMAGKKIRVGGNVTGRIVGIVKVPVLNAQRGTGETIQESDIAWMDVEENTLGTKPITTTDQLIGKRVERLIQAQTIIHAGMVKSPVLVRKNSLVTITYETGSMLISNQVKALEDGAMDEVIRVQNSQSNRIIDAVVVGSDHVQSGSRAKTLAMK
jgi:flagella basal body P-ring formation protein FlgA